MGNAIDAVEVFVVFIKRQFVLHVIRDQQAACHAYGEAGDIDNTVDFPAEEVTVCDFDEMFEHVNSV